MLAPDQSTSSMSTEFPPETPRSEEGPRSWLQTFWKGGGNTPLARGWESFALARSAPELSDSVLSEDSLTNKQKPQLTGQSS